MLKWETQFPALGNTFACFLVSVLFMYLPREEIRYITPLTCTHKQFEFLVFVF